MTIFVVIHKICPNHCLVSFRESNWCDFSHSDSNQSDLSRCSCDSNRNDFKFQIFCAQLFQLKNYSCAQRFWKYCRLQGFKLHLLLHHSKTQPFQKIQHFLVKEVEAQLNGNLWAYASDSYWLIQTDTDDVITITPESFYLHFNTTLQTYKRDVPITMYQYVNGSTILVGVNNDWVTFCIVQKQSPKRLWSTSYRELFIPFSYNRQRYRLQPSPVGLSQFVHYQLLRGIFTNRHRH